MSVPTLDEGWGWGAGSRWPVPSAVPGPAGAGGVERVPPMDSEAMALLSGRAWRSWEFRAVVILAVSGLVAPAAFLLVWATRFGSHDASRSAQVAWAVLLVVGAIVTVALTARTGTEVTPQGIRRRNAIGSTRLDWWEVAHFVDVSGESPLSGIRVVPRGGSDQPFLVPTALSVVDAGEASRRVRALNQAFGRTVPPSKVPDAFGTGKTLGPSAARAKRYWGLPFASGGAVVPGFLLWSALKRRSLGLVVLAALSIDVLWLCFLAVQAGGDPNAGWVPPSTVLTHDVGLLVWSIGYLVLPTLWLLVVWGVAALRGRRSERGKGTETPGRTA